MALNRYNSSLNFVTLILFFIYSNALAIEEEFSESHQVLKQELPSAKSLDENNVSNSNGNIPRFNRQLDSDVESRFHITKNTIIRTGESRILGAKYLNETVIPSNHDCLTWCLETPNCNAVVYEEKNVHSCYMFDCGSPSTFLCKFTPHNYFISSVLKITQHSYDLQQWGNQVKHEKELAELRTSDSHETTSPPTADQKTVIVTSEIPLKINNGTKPVSKCHHYQFQCINSTECIAIYNVCDGIPQCPDGSDESVDLKCHMKEIPDTIAKTQRPVEPPRPTETKTNNQPPVLNRPPQQPPVRPPQKVRIPQANDRPKVPPNKASSRHMDNSKSVWQDRLPDEQPSRSDYYQNSDDSDGLGSPFKHSHSQFVAANDPHVQSLNRWSNDYDQYPPHSVPYDQPFNAYDGNYQRVEDQYLANPMPPEYDGVKNYGNYRQEDVPYWTNQDTAQENTYPVEEFPQPALHGLSKPEKDSIYTQQLARTAAQYPDIKRPIIHKPLEQPVEEYKSRRYPVPRQPPYVPYEEPSYPEGKLKHYIPSPDESAYSNDDLIRASLVNQLPMELDRPHHIYQYEKHKEGEPHVHSKIKESIEVTSSTTVKPTKHPKPVQRTVLDFKMSVTELYQASRTRSQETNSAILALVMGLTITVLLFVFLACRIKTIRKRMSRKGRALAHDADYLVNGMYL